MKERGPLFVKKKILQLCSIVEHTDFNVPAEQLKSLFWDIPAQLPETFVVECFLACYLVDVVINQYTRASFRCAPVALHLWADLNAACGPFFFSQSNTEQLSALKFTLSLIRFVVLSVLTMSFCIYFIACYWH